MALYTKGWREAAGDDPGKAGTHLSVADIVDAGSLQKVRSYKKADQGFPPPPPPLTVRRRRRASGYSDYSVEVLLGDSEPGDGLQRAQLADFLLTGLPTGQQRGNRIAIRNSEELLDSWLLRHCCGGEHATEALIALRPAGCSTRTGTPRHPPPR